MSSSTEHSCWGPENLVDFFPQRPLLHRRNPSPAGFSVADCSHWLPTTADLPCEPRPPVHVRSRAAAQNSFGPSPTALQTLVPILTPDFLPPAARLSRSRRRPLKEVARASRRERSTTNRIWSTNSGGGDLSMFFLALLLALLAPLALLLALLALLDFGILG
jgi:hypothetical protein